MQSRYYWNRLLGYATLAALAVLVSAPAYSADKSGWYHTVIDGAFVEKYAVLPRPDGVMIVDSRPKARKYDKGHIPGAVSIPETQFDKHVALLPKDKSALLIFYCGGTECKLSHKSAFKAEKLGYSNIKVYANGYPDWIKRGNMVSVGAPYVKKLIDTNAKVMVIDSRPKKRKYDKGHIPTAVSLPDSDFEKMAKDVLPKDKSTPLIFYCGGYECKLSANSAEKAKKLGYSDVKTYTAGMPDWKAAYGKAAVATGAGGTKKKAAIKAGGDDGTISIASFKDVVDNSPDSVMIVDVRDAEEYKSGTLPGAVNIPINQLEKKIAGLPADKPIIFICGTGGRSGEAYDMVQLFRPELEAYFLDAVLKINKDGSYTVKPHAG